MGSIFLLECESGECDQLFFFFFFLQIVQRRIDLLAAEGIKFINNAEVGKNVDAQQILDDNDAVLLAVGSTCPRNIPLPGNFFRTLRWSLVS